MNKLVFKVNEKACVAFLKKYPLVCNLMENSNGKDLMSAYKKFLKLKDMNESLLEKLYCELNDKIAEEALDEEVDEPEYDSAGF